MNRTTKITCPQCEKVQAEDIIELTEGEAFDGIFKHECDGCKKVFTVEFEFVPYVKTY